MTHSRFMLHLPAGPQRMPISVRSIARVLLLSLLLRPAVALAQEDVHVFRGATIYPVSSEPVEDGVLVIRGQTIEALGSSGSVQVPDGAREHDVSGKIILPGLVDTHSHVGRVEGGDASGPLHPGVRTLDAIDVLHHSFKRARAGGITTVNVMSGSGHLMSGQTVYLKLRNGRIIDDLLFCEDPIAEICGGMKMANGTNSIRASAGPFPGTRAKSAALARQLFVDALTYKRQHDEARQDTSKNTPARDLGKEALLDVLAGRRIVHFHTHRHDDILTVLRLKEEFGFDVVLHHVSEAWKVADEIAAAGVPSSIIVLDAPGGKLEASEIAWINGVALEEAGADVAYHTDDYITDSRLFLRSAAFGVRAGMSRQKALESLTIAGARMLGLDDRVGSLEPAKDADFIVLSGDPFSAYTKVEQTWIEGERVFDLSNPDDRKYAVGGYGVFDGAAFDHLGVH